MSLYYKMNTTLKKGKKPRVNKYVAHGSVNYSKALLSRKVHIPIVNVGKNLKDTLKRAIALSIEGKCIEDGFVKPDSCNVIAHSSGILKGHNVSFEVSFECLVCYPVNGMKISCIAKNITKAGIRAESEETPNPIVIFIARDHHNKMEYFSQVKTGDKIRVSVIGHRFELNDKYISIIAELIEAKKQKLVIKET